MFNQFLYMGLVLVLRFLLVPEAKLYWRWYVRTDTLRSDLNCMTTSLACNRMRSGKKGSAKLLN